MGIKITWEVEDGYVGKSRPQYTTIPDDEFYGCETDEEREQVIAEWVQNEFDNKISWCITNRDVE